MKTKKKIPVYFVPGMAAGPQTFSNIHLPEEDYRVTVIEWIIPMADESLTHYAKRMSEKVKEPNAVLVGVSFGGVVAQEMEQFLSLRNLIIISSIKNKTELPIRMWVTGTFKFYKLFPTSKILSAKDLTRFSIGPRSKKRLALYQKYLDVRNKTYLDWAIKQMTTWSRNETVAGLVHIHGAQDSVFPIKHIQNCIVIQGGTHIMLLTKGRELSELLRQLIEKEDLKIEKNNYEKDK